MRLLTSIFDYFPIRKISFISQLMLLTQKLFMCAYIGLTHCQMGENTPKSTEPHFAPALMYAVADLLWAPPCGRKYLRPGRGLKGKKNYFLPYNLNRSGSATG